MRKFINSHLKKNYKSTIFVRYYTLTAMLGVSLIVSTSGLCLFFLFTELNVTFSFTILLYCVVLISSLIAIITTKKIILVNDIHAIIFTVYMVALYYASPATVGQYTLFWACFIPCTLVLRNSFRLIIIATIATGILLYALLYNDRAESLGATPESGYYFLINLTLISFLISTSIFFLLRLLDENHQKAIYDKTTGLYNRHMLEIDNHICYQEYTEQSKDYYILFIDLDHFKEINDLFGHETGDKLLFQLGGRLKQFCRHYNENLSTTSLNVYRYGGDEFIFLLQPGATITNSDFRRLLEDIILLIESPYKLSEYQVKVNASIGIARSNTSTNSAEELISFADIAMYTHKHAGKLNFSDNDTLKSYENWQHKFLIYRELKSALKRQEFTLLYQPFFSTQSLEVSGCEALLRWHSNELGLVPSEDFIPIAEATGLINELSIWVIKQTLKKIIFWKKIKNNFIIAINLSPYQLRNHGLIKQLNTIFTEDKQAYLENLEFELTESISITNSPHITSALNDIRSMGISLSLDDFGQGKTSFLELKQAAFDKLKLDKGLLWDATQNPVNRKIVEAIVRSAQSLGMKVTTEGVETEEQLQLAQSWGCDVIQGFLLAKPQTGAEVNRLLLQTSNTNKLIEKLMPGST